MAWIQTTALSFELFENNTWRKYISNPYAPWGEWPGLPVLGAGLGSALHRKTRSNCIRCHRSPQKRAFAPPPSPLLKQLQELREKQGLHIPSHEFHLASRRRGDIWSPKETAAEDCRKRAFPPHLCLKCGSFTIPWFWQGLPAPSTTFLGVERVGDLAWSLLLGQPQLSNS